VSDLNRVFNNQISVNGTTSYFATEQLKKKIVKQLAGKPPVQQEAIIEQLLKLLDINLLAALAMAYAVADEKQAAL